MPSIDASSFSPLARQRWADAAALARASWTRSGGEASGAAEPAPAAWQDRIADSSRRLIDDAQQGQVSALQQRQATLQKAADLLTRIAELKQLADDPTAGEEARGSYETEFAERQADLLALTDEEGEPLFVGSALSFATADAEATVPAATNAAEDEFVPFRDTFETTEAWESDYGALAVSEGTFFPSAGGYGAARTLREFSGALEVKFDLFLPGAADSLELSLGGQTLSNLTDTVNIAKWEQRSVRIVYDGVDRAATYLDGSDEAVDVRSGLGELAGALQMVNFGLGSARLRNFEVNRANEDAVSKVRAAEIFASEAVAEEIVEEEAVREVVDAEELAEVDAATLEAFMEEIREEQSANTDALEALGAESEVGSAAEIPLEESLADQAAAFEAGELARQEILLDGAAVLVAQANLDERDVWALLG